MAVVEVWSKKPAEYWADQLPGHAHVEVDRHKIVTRLTTREMDALANQIIDTVMRHPEILRNR